MAVLFFSAVTLLFLDFTGTAAEWFGWTAKIQFLPSLLAANFAVVAGLVLLTLLFGRIYCSVICPLGVLQDVFSHAAGRRKRNRFAYAPAMTLVRAAGRIAIPYAPSEPFSDFLRNTPSSNP